MADPLAPGDGLDETFYRGSVLQLAPRLIGSIVAHRAPTGTTLGRIVEVEAYRGPADRAAHSHRGRRTERTEAMFGRRGTVYMFRLYGMHWAFNIVAGERDQPHAILVRALEPVEEASSVALMSLRRFQTATPSAKQRLELCRGPGKLCQAMGLDQSHYGADLTRGSLVLMKGKRSSLGRSPRINIDYAGADKARPWRFFERGNRYISVAPRV